MRSFSARSRESLTNVHPDLVRVITAALQSSPVDFIVIEGRRTTQRQAELVAKGASQTMNSRHITGHAVDLLPIGADGKGAFDWPLYHKLAPAVKAEAKRLGVAIVWGGDWRSFKDGPHFELDRSVYPASAPWPAAQPAAPVVDHVPAPPATEHPPAPWWADIVAAIARLFAKKG